MTVLGEGGSVASAFVADSGWRQDCRTVIPAQAGIHVSTSCEHYPLILPKTTRNRPSLVIASEARQSPEINHRTLDVLLRIKEYAMNKQPAVYLLTNRPDGTLYTGVTSDLPKRIWQHRNKVTKGFTTKETLINSEFTSLRAKRGNLLQWNQSVRDCRVTSFLAMTNESEVP